MTGTTTLDLHGDSWKQFHKMKNGKIKITPCTDVLITHIKNKDGIFVQEKSPCYSWSNMGFAEINLSLKPGDIMQFHWADRADSKGNAVNDTYLYEVLVVSNDLLIQKKFGMEKFSFGNWIRRSEYTNDKIKSLKEDLENVKALLSEDTFSRLYSFLEELNKDVS